MRRADGRIPGGEPLMYPQIEGIVEGLVARKKYVYLCTNAMLLKEKLDLFTPSKYLTFSVHMDGAEGARRCRSAAKASTTRRWRGSARRVSAGFRVTTNTTLFDGADPNSVRAFFDEMMELGVEGMMLSPGLQLRQGARPGALPWQERGRRAVPQDPVEPRSKRWQFNQSPLFLEFLMGKRDYECTPWGKPTYNIFGWQRPCYLLQEGYADTFEELMEHGVGRVRDRERQPEMRQLHGALRVRGDGGARHVHFCRVATVAGQLRQPGTLFSRYKDKAALEALNNPVKPSCMRVPGRCN